VYEGLSFGFTWLLGLMSRPPREPARAPDLIG